jgi:uracil phosphoribosyltransferase
MNLSLKPSVSVEVVDHPLVATRLGSLRDKNTTNATFRSSLADLSTMLIYEATRDYPVEETGIETPVAEASIRTVGRQPLLVPVLRAGLGMAEAAFRLFPDAQMGFVGLARNEETHAPASYLESLPANIGDQPVFVLDPMLATGGSANRCLEVLAGRGATEVTLVCVLASPEGIEALGVDGVSLKLVTASIDDKLNEDAYIVPGLGDAGDRQFGAV